MESFNEFQNKGKKLPSINVFIKLQELQLIMQLSLVCIDARKSHKESYPYINKTKNGYLIHFLSLFEWDLTWQKK